MEYEMIFDTKIWQLWSEITDKLAKVPAPDINLFARLYIAQIFFLSGRTKAAAPDGEGIWQTIIAFISPSDTAISLFEEEYALPLISPEIAAQLALFAETLLPILLVIGLATRLSALSLLAMTAVIQIFVYPNLWHEHMVWIAVLLLLLLRGGGNISLDQRLVKKYSNNRTIRT